MCSALNPSYKLQGRRGLLSDLYVTLQDKQVAVQALFKNEAGGSAATTHDSWTSKNGQTFASLSCHYISEDFELFSCPFDVMKLSGNTYATCIAETVTSMAEKRGIQPTVNVTDCEPAMVAAWRHMGHGGQGCFAHRIEKVSAVFFKCPGHEEVMKKARKLVGLFAHSTQAAETLNNLVIAYIPDHPRGLKTIQDVSTRWWSTYYAMCERFIVLRPALTRMLPSQGLSADAQLTDKEWTVIQLGVTALKPLMQAQKEMEAELYVTNSLVAGTITLASVCHLFGHSH